MQVNYISTLILVILFFSQCQMKNESNIQESRSKFVEISTDKIIYPHSHRERINITAVNISEQTLFYLSPSINATLQRYEAGQWIELGPWYDVIAIVPRKISVSPGDKIPVTPLTSDDAVFKRLGDYRICLNFYTDQNTKQSLPLNDRVSNSFKIIE